MKKKGSNEQEVEFQRVAGNNCKDWNIRSRELQKTFIGELLFFFFFFFIRGGGGGGGGYAPPDEALRSLSL